MDAPTFASAPPWYRTVLRAEDALLYSLRDRLPTSAHLQDGEVETSGFVLNERLGVLAAERMVPGNNASPYMVQHVARYVWAMSAVQGKRVADLGCGDGYGSELLSWVCPEVIGVDVSEEALGHARECYSGPEFRQGDLTQPAGVPDADVAVCFEVLEHLHDGPALLRSVSSRVPRLLLSFPNPLVGGSHINPHHVNDWPLSTVKANLRRAGAKKITSYHQSLWSHDVRRFASSIHTVWILDIRF